MPDQPRPARAEVGPAHVGRFSGDAPQRERMPLPIRLGRAQFGIGSLAGGSMGGGGTCTQKNSLIWQARQRLESCTGRTPGELPERQRYALSNVR